MKKIFFLKSFSWETDNFKYRDEIIPYFSYFNLYFAICGIIFIVDRNNQHHTGIILGVIFALWFFQTIALIVRLIMVSENKIDIKILNNKYNFKYKPKNMFYDEFKHFIIHTNSGLKLYCSDENGNNHIIHIKVLINKFTGIKKFYYLDRIEYEINELLIEINNKNIIDGSMIKIMGCEEHDLSNDELIKLIRLSSENVEN